jgi:uncharacterized membrane protein
MVIASVENGGGGRGIGFYRFCVFCILFFQSLKLFAMAEKLNGIENIERRLNYLENRVSELEAALLNPERERVYSENDAYNSEATSPLFNSIEDADKGIESRIGQYGLAWLGNIVLFVGITFLVQYLLMQGHSYSSVILGYVSSVAILLLGNYLKKSNDNLAFMFRMNGQILLFFITLRLHFFSASPLIADKTIPVILLLLIVAFQAYMAIREKSQAFGTLSVIFALITAVSGEATHFMLPLIALTAFGSVYYYYKYNWKALLITTIILCYVSFSFWIVGNPVMGHTMKLISADNSGVIYLFALGACYSGMLIMRKEDKSIDDFLISVTFVNGVIFTVMLVFIVVGFYSKNYVVLFTVITFFCLVYSVVLHSRSEWNFGAAYYALYGFMAMSIALYGVFGFPLVFLLLSVQSLIVVSMALWFRNKLIVVMNSLLFLTIMLVYLISSKSVDSVNFSFALISLVSARIINWKKSRLHIETDLIRNLYLIEGFFMVLIALYHAVPGQFITLSWTIAALVYFILSFILKNVKYRYLALGTMISAALYLFLFDLARIEIIYRVLALLFLSAISIGISIYYSNSVKKSDN